MRTIVVTRQRCHMARCPRSTAGPAGQQSAAPGATHMMLHIACWCAALQCTRSFSSFKLTTTPENDYTHLSLVSALESKSSRVRRTSLCDACAARPMTTLIAGAGRDGRTEQGGRLYRGRVDQQTFSKVSAGNSFPLTQDTSLRNIIRKDAQDHSYPRRRLYGFGPSRS